MERKKTLDGGKLMHAKPRKKRWSKGDTMVVKACF